MSKTILIVEDNKLNMKLFNDLLQARGFITLQSFDGVDAIDLAKEHNPALIITDIQLKGISGIDIIKTLKADISLQNIPVIAVTALAMKGDEEKIREAGCDDYISKPISVPNFLETINSYFD